MYRTLVILKHTFIEAVVQPIYPLLIALGSAVMVIYAMLPFFTLSEDTVMYKSVSLDVVLLLVLISTLFATSKSVFEEIEDRTMLTLMSKPVKKWEVLLGKYLGISLSALVAVLALGLVIAVSTWWRIPNDYQISTSAIDERDVQKLADLRWMHISGLIPGLALKWMQITVLAAVGVALSVQFSLVVNLPIVIFVYIAGNLTRFLYPLEGQSAITAALAAAVPAEFRPGQGDHLRKDRRGTIRAGSRIDQAGDDLGVCAQGRGVCGDLCDHLAAVRAVAVRRPGTGRGGGLTSSLGMEESNPQTQFSPPPMPMAVMPMPMVLYANFGQRLLAWFIDRLILLAFAFVVAGVVVGIPTSIVPVDQLSDGAKAIMGFTWMGVFYLGTWLYYALMECSNSQATLGKRAMGLKVLDIDGESPTFTQTSVRFFCRLLSIITLGFGFLLCLFTRRAQTMHDIGANCVVVVEQRTAGKFG
jgi:uncharacterized RDD family membrane protein YckC/ABC-type transport system involved in multi-copper enzyme maturation permease subunit